MKYVISLCHFKEGGGISERLGKLSNVTWLIGGSGRVGNLVCFDSRGLQPLNTT